MATTTAPRPRRAPELDPHEALSRLESRLLRGEATAPEVGFIIDALRAVVDGSDPAEFVTALTGDPR